MTETALHGAFADPPRDAARAFRGALQALSRPGRIVTLSGASAPAPLSPAAATLLLTLADATTPLHLAGGHDCAALRDWVRFHCGAPLVGAEDAQFAVGTWQALAPLDRYRIGTPDYPDRAATLIVEVEDLKPQGTRLSGPGIRETASLSLPDPAAFADNHALFPLGWDAFLTAGSKLAGLPRSTRVEAA